ncbi:MAG: rRNA maturation RNase YbeY [Candidatus Magasanikbacteria bacterium]|mgnify:FL=1|jgi:probable rRNA maturation factor|nr:rRNA maturation RNase YbeY [Candidatus Magasanikbacteria bacterium]MBT4072056.1 rRNA maturation RNase YbeY [Candidatus Magasanikbacteria bacterium]
MSVITYSTIKRVGISKKTIESVVFFVLKSCKKTGDVSVHCIGDTRMQTLNRIYRGKNKPTDVLSFALQEGMWGGESTDELGDIFISIPYIKRQAKRMSVSYKQEFRLMLIHGVLHLLGYDHEKKSDAKKMFALQEELLKRICSHI